MPHMQRRGAYLDSLITFINETVDPPVPVFGRRVKLDPTTRWSASIWLVITVTMARKRINIPELIITTKNQEALTHFLLAHPAWANAIDTALHKVGYLIDYHKLAAISTKKGAP